jgi:hypothetical protein
MFEVRLLVRAALKLRDVYLARAARIASERLQDWFGGYGSALERARTIIRQVAADGSPENLLQARRSLLQVQSVVQNIVARGCRRIAELVPPIPDLRSLVEELRQLADEFGDLDVVLKKKTIGVSTETIQLNDVYLGPFSIEFSWPRLERSVGVDCFAITALDPHPAPGNSSIPHPHVRNGALCAGEAVEPMTRALEQGRLADAFCLVRSVLVHYNPKSPHVPLEDWLELQCTGCGCYVAANDVAYCENCGHDFCRDCTCSCAACEATRCYECLARCSVCEVWHCANCMGRCASSGRPCCEGCLRTCAACGAEVACDELDEPATLCPSCRRAPASTSPAPASNATTANNETVNSETCNDASNPWPSTA